MKNILLMSVVLLPVISFAQFSFDPFFTYGEFERIEDVRNLDISSDRIAYKANSSNGYKVLTSRKIYAGLGVKRLSNITRDGSYFTSIGLVPNYDAYAKWMLSFSNREELESFKYSIPKSIEDIDSYKPGDAVYWNVKGGISLMVGVGYRSIAKIWTKLHIDGGYSVFIEKKSNTQLYIEVRKIKTGSASVVGGTLIGYAEAQKLAEKSHGVAFTLDISSSEGKELYSGLINDGNVSAIQESKEAFNKVYDVSGFKKLSSRQAAIGLPVFPIIQFKREYNTEELVDSRVSVDQFNNIYKDTFSVQRNITKLFAKKSYMEKMAILNESNDLKKTSLIWQKKSTRFTFNKLNRTLRRLINLTGISFNVDIPNYKQKIGFARIKYELVLSNSLREAFEKKYGITTAKSLVKSLQRKLKNSYSFSTILDAVKKCGGSWKLLIYGKNINTFERKEEFPEDFSCNI